MIVSAIISTYNSAKFIAYRIENLLNQTLSKNLEIIVVISGSTQNEKEIIDKYLKNHHNIKIIVTTERESIYKAWNRGIKISTGKYITNANTDDVLKEDALEILTKELDDNPQIAMVFASQYLTNMPFANFQKKFPEKFNRPNYSRLKFLSKYLVGPQPMWRSSLHFNDNIWFDESLEVCGDNDFACRIMEKYNIKKVEGILGIYFKPDDLSNKEFQKRELTLKESNSVRDKYSRRFISSLNNSQKFKIEILIIVYKVIPRVIFKVLNYIMKKLLPKWELIEREYIFYLASLLAEKENSISRAIAYCKPFLEDKNAVLMHLQYLNLTSSQTYPK